MSDLLTHFQKYQKEVALSLPPTSQLLLLREDVLSLSCWEWDYEESLAFQQKIIPFIRAHKAKHYKFFLFCNHPPVYTLGRGLQKQSGKVMEGLIENNPSLLQTLSYPLHKIERGGGLTFHHLGQWICYPIIYLDGDHWGLSYHFDWLLEQAAFILQDLFSLSVETKRKTAGLWCEDKKIASVGVAIDRFVTYHGIAVNIYPHLGMREDMQKLYPCGLSPLVYSSVEELIIKTSLSNKDCLLKRFHAHFLSNFSLQKK